MALARQTTAELVKPLQGYISRKGTLGTTVEASESVTLQTDGFWDPSNAAAAQLNSGIALQDGVVTDVIDIVTFGPVSCMTGATIGGLVYISNTAGELSATAGTKSTALGYAESATVLFVKQQIVDFT